MSSSNESSIDQSGLVKVDQQLATLEENIVKLKASLRHWQTWEIDYEGLREEFERLAEDCTDKEILAAAKDVNAEALDAKEIESLVQASGSSGRRRPQLIDRLAKRLDYVIRNANTVKNQLSDTQKKRNTLLLAESSEHRDDAALPLTEVIEELDENDRIISSSTETPKNTAPELVEVLRKAGVKDIEMAEGVVRSSLNPFDEQRQISASSQEDAGSERVDTPLTDEALSKGGKSDSRPLVSQSDSDSESDFTSPVLLASDSVEDALLRREMLNYTPNEVGAVVAQLELDLNSDDNDSDASIHDFMDEDDLQLDDSEDGDALDDFGQSVKRPFSEEYQHEMLALERKLNARSMQNVGPTPAILPEHVGDTMGAQTQGHISSQLDHKPFKPQAKKCTKRVSFANDLHIAPLHRDQSDSQQSSYQHNSSVMFNTLPERAIQSSTAHPPLPSSKTPRVSKFMADRSASTQSSRLLNHSSRSFGDQPASALPDDMRDKIQSDIVVERPSHPSKSANKPPTNDELDTILHRNEIAGEFYRMRNRMIHQQGGFTEQPDPQEEVVIGDITGRKVSRFKAARMK